MKVFLACFFIVGIFANLYFFCVSKLSNLGNIKKNATIQGNETDKRQNRLRRMPHKGQTGSSEGDSKG